MFKLKCYGLKFKELIKSFQIYLNRKKVEVEVLILDKLFFKFNRIKQDKKKY